MATADQPAQFILVRLVLQHVHDRVDAAVGEHGEHGEVVVVAGEVDGRAEVEGEEHELVEGVTEEVADDDDEQRLQQVASGARLLHGRLAADVWPERVHLGAQAHEHPAVAGDEQEDRKQVLHYEQHHPETFFHVSLAWIAMILQRPSTTPEVSTRKHSMSIGPGHQAALASTRIFVFERKVWWKRGKTIPTYRSTVRAIRLYDDDNIRLQSGNSSSQNLQYSSSPSPDRLPEVVPESQCGFRGNQSTVDMIFFIRQLQEKRVEQDRLLHIVFVDFSKAFNAVGRTGLWQLLRKYGCPEKFTTMIEALHIGMMANVSVGWKVSESFCVTNGVKKSCLLAPRAFLHLPISNGRRLFPRHGRWRLHTVQTDH